MKKLDLPAKEALVMSNIRNAFRFFPIDQLPSPNDIQENMHWLDEENVEVNISIPVKVDGEEKVIYARFNFSFDDGHGVRMSMVMPDYPTKGMRQRFTSEIDRMPAETMAPVKVEQVEL